MKMIGANLIVAECEPQIRHVPLKVLDVGEIAVELGVQGRELVDVRVEGGRVVLAQDLREDKFMGYIYCGFILSDSFDIHRIIDVYL